VLGLDAVTLTALVYGEPHPPWFKCTSRAQEVAVRRALHGLERQGLVIGPLKLGDDPGTWRLDVAKYPVG
jgi:hypothetical protein